MPIFISYSREDTRFVDSLAANLVMHHHHIWMDRWELNIGDSLIQRIQDALTTSSAILVILSKHSVASEWCKKELNSGLLRELTEKKVVVIPCVIDDCNIPLFIKDKLYADFRKDPDQAFADVENSLRRITNKQQGRLESPDFHTDWSYDWKTGRSGASYFEWMFVEHGKDVEYSILTRCMVVCNEFATQEFGKLNKDQKQAYIRSIFSKVMRNVSLRKFKMLLSDAFEQFELFKITGTHRQAWLVEISSRRMGIDNGKDTLVHIDKVFEQTLLSMESEKRPENKKKSRSTAPKRPRTTTKSKGTKG